MRLVFSINIEVLAKNYVIALWIIYILALSSNLSKVINIICDWIIHIMRLALEYSYKTV